MDWNKSNTILIIAFVVLNIILLVSYFGNTNSKEYDVMSDSQFMESVEGMLKQKNIEITGSIPRETYTLPLLETEYEIITADNQLVQNYLGAGVEAVDEVYEYYNNLGEKLEITDGKKLIYTAREQLSGKAPDEESMIRFINDFVAGKNIDVEGYSENRRFVSDEMFILSYTQKYKDYSMDNSYMYFYADSKGIFKFEMQRINSVKEIPEKVRTVTAVEALVRLLTYDDVKDKKISEIEMTYYSTEDENWQYITRINSDPTWKVIFTDGSQKHLTSVD
ncbi:MAG: two-component system regulatory protein YycI [Sedimentibacter sp.]|uniref:two-component system regulatory protein YycI n=1 Tax=Sedimentibacter sp. TaxID=1960295 RepID=UPI0031594BC4